MQQVSLRKLMEAGAHFGHQTFRWDPRMKPFIFGARNGIHIIDLDQTLVALQQAYTLVENVVASGKEVLFVGTKRQAQNILVESSSEVGMPYVIHRWLGGMLTNFSTIRQSVKRLKNLQEKLADESSRDMYTKKELVMFSKEATKLHRNLSGIAEMTKLPGAVFVVDPKTEHIAIAEARRCNIPVIALTDTNCDPRGVDIVIPANDDAFKSIELLAGTIKEACKSGQQKFEARARQSGGQQKDAQDASKRESGTKNTKLSTISSGESGADEYSKLEPTEDSEKK